MMKTLKTFTEKSHIDAGLIRAVVRQIGGWQSFKEAAQDVARYGADAGVSGFIYYSDTVPFFKRNKNEILSMAKNTASDFGDEYLTMIAGFNCLKGCTVDDVADAIFNSRTSDPENVRNALAWFALEEVARNYCDLSD